MGVHGTLSLKGVHWIAIWLDKSGNPKALTFHDNKLAIAHQNAMNAKLGYIWHLENQCDSSQWVAAEFDSSVDDYDNELEQKCAKSKIIKHSHSSDAPLPVAASALK